MPSNTPWLDFTIPVDTDLIADVAAIVAQGFDDVEAALFLTENSRDQQTPPVDWPRGMSLMGFTSAAPSGSWPEAGGLILNLRRYGSASTYQLMFAGNESPRIQVRQGDVNAGWNHWRPVGRAEASGMVVANGPAAGGTVTRGVTFPEGRFTSPPRVFAQVYSSVPEARHVSVGGVTTTGFDLYLNAPNDSSVSIAWNAVQGD